MASNLGVGTELLQELHFWCILLGFNKIWAAIPPSVPAFLGNFGKLSHPKRAPLKSGCEISKEII